MRDALPTTKQQGAALVEPPVHEYAIASSLLSIAKSTRAFLTLFLAEIGLHPGQDQLLEMLELERPVGVSMLAGRLAVRPSTVSKMLDRLIEKGLVSRTDSQGDGRRTMVLLTPDGEAMRRRIHEVWHRLQNEFVTQLSADDVLTLTLSLKKTETVLATRLRRLR